MYSKKKMEEALKVYHTTKSVGKTVQKLGCPTRRQCTLGLIMREMFRRIESNYLKLTTQQFIRETHLPRLS